LGGSSPSGSRRGGAGEQILKSKRPVEANKNDAGGIDTRNKTREPARVRKSDAYPHLYVSPKKKHAVSETSRRKSTRGKKRSG